MEPFTTVADTSDGEEIATTRDIGSGTRRAPNCSVRPLARDTLMNAGDADRSVYVQANTIVLADGDGDGDGADEVLSDVVSFRRGVRSRRKPLERTSLTISTELMAYTRSLQGSIDAVRDTVRVPKVSVEAFDMVTDGDGVFGRVKVDALRLHVAVGEGFEMEFDQKDEMLLPESVAVPLLDNETVDVLVLVPDAPVAVAEEPSVTVGGIAKVTEGVADVEIQTVLDIVSELVTEAAFDSDARMVGVLVGG